MRDRILEVTGSSDAELVARVRAGDNEAFADLYDRHQEAAHRLARQLTRGGDTDDLVSEAFTRVLMLLQGGGGPDVAFRAYLLTAVRRLYVDRLRGQQRVHTTDDVTEFDPGIPFQDTAVDQFERRTTARAFASLPERWQLVLWHLDVERQKPAEVAPLLGLSPNSVSALAYRAREGLRQAYLQMHLADTEDQVCRWTTERLGAYVRDNLARRESRQVRQHLEECPRCTAVYLELAEVNSNLRGVLAPLLLGAAGTGYLASTPVAGAGGAWSLVSQATEVVKAGGSTVGAGAAGTAAAAAVTLALVIGSGGSPAPEPGAGAAERSVTSPATTERGAPGEPREPGEPVAPAAGVSGDDRRVSSLLAGPGGVPGVAGTAVGRPGRPGAGRSAGGDDAPKDRPGQDSDADARGSVPESGPADEQNRTPGSDADAPGPGSSGGDAPGPGRGSDRGDGGPRGEGPRGDRPGGDGPSSDSGDGPPGPGSPSGPSDPRPGQSTDPNPPPRDQDPPGEPGNGSDNSGSGGGSDNSGSGGGSDNSGSGGGSDDDESRDSEVEDDDERSRDDRKRGSDDDRDDRSRDDRKRGSDDDTDDRSRDDRKRGSDDDCQPGKGDDKGRGKGLDEGHGRGNDCDRD